MNPHRFGRYLDKGSADSCGNRAENPRRFGRYRSEYSFARRSDIRGGNLPFRNGGNASFWERNMVWEGWQRIHADVSAIWAKGSVDSAPLLTSEGADSFPKWWKCVIFGTKYGVVEENTHTLTCRFGVGSVCGGRCTWLRVRIRSGTCSQHTHRRRSGVRWKCI